MHYGIARNTTSPSFEPRYVDHAIMALNAIGKDGGKGPDIFHLELPRFSTRHDRPHPVDWAHMVQSWLGFEWRGKFLVSTQKAYAMNFDSRHYVKPETYARFDERRRPGEDKRNIEYLDETHMALSALHDIEDGLAQPYWSEHFHRRCAHQGMHVCSVVCDACLQQILNLAYKTKRTFSSIDIYQNQARRNDKNVPAASSTPMEFCLFCPPRLVPFTIRPLVDKNAFTCSNYVPVARHA
jgi:hypothetical protein